MADADTRTVVAGNPDPNQGRVPVETVPAAPADQTPPAAETPAAPATPAETPQEPAVPPLSPREAQRKALADRFKESRAAHDKEFTAQDTPPFVEKQKQEAAAQSGVDGASTGQGEAPAEGAPAADGSPSAKPASPPDPAAAAPQPFVLNVRGRPVQVKTREDLAQIAGFNPSDAASFTDDQLRLLAERSETEKSYRQDAAPRQTAPAQQPAAEPNKQEAPSIPSEEDIEKLRLTKIEKAAYGEPAEAAEAEKAFDKARDARRAALESEQYQRRSFEESVNRDVIAFAERNRDIVSDPDANALVMRRVTQEMGDDLIKLGASEQEIASIRHDTQGMTRFYNDVRARGVVLRSNNELLEAAGSYVRDRLRMPAPTAQQVSQQPSPQRSPADRTAEKRGLPAQPTRSSTPPSPEPAQPDVMASRRAALDKARQARRGNNLQEKVGAA